MVWIFVCAFLSFGLLASAESICDPDYGPVGPTTRWSVECVDSRTHYDKHQWATCVSNIYIKQKSKGTDGCEYDVKYCWDQCMAETYGIFEGPVYDYCACEPTVVTTKAPEQRLYPIPAEFDPFKPKVAEATTNALTRRPYITTTEAVRYKPRPIVRTNAPEQDYNPTTDNDLRYKPGPVENDQTTAGGLPGWCASPDGTNCDWFEDCLQKRYHCSSTITGHAVDFASTFCNMYTLNRHRYSSHGQQWLDAVRKCLQVELVPFIRPFAQTDCKKIQNTAFAAQPMCYDKPYAGEPSICDLDPRDWAKVFWTIEGAFPETQIASLSELMKSKRQCGNFSIEDVHDMRLIMLTFKKTGRHSEKKDQIETAHSVTKQFAVQLLWKQHGVQWFPYLNDDYEQGEQNPRVGILLGSRSIHDVNAVSSAGVPDADMSKTVDDFAFAIGNGKLHLNISSDLSIVYFSACRDFVCEESYHDVTPKLSSAAAKTEMPGFMIAIVGGILMNLLIC